MTDTASTNADRIVMVDPCLRRYVTVGGNDASDTSARTSRITRKGRDGSGSGARAASRLCTAFVNHDHGRSSSIKTDYAPRGGRAAGLQRPATAAAAASPASRRHADKSAKPYCSSDGGRVWALTMNLCCSVPIHHCAAHWAAARGVPVEEMIAARCWIAQVPDGGKSQSGKSQWKRSTRIGWHSNTAALFGVFMRRCLHASACGSCMSDVPDGATALRAEWRAFCTRTDMA